MLQAGFERGTRGGGRTGPAKLRASYDIEAASSVFLGSILVPADETVFCLFNGSEADVRAVNERAGVPFERVLESLRIDGQ